MSSGLTLGVRIFITTYLFHRFPRLRKRLDTYGWFYHNLPVKAARNSPATVSTAPDGLSLLTNKTNSPLRRRPVNANGLFTSRLGSNFNLLETGSQHNLTQNNGSALGVHNLVKKWSAPNLRATCKDSTDCLNDQSSPIPHLGDECTTKMTADSFDSLILPIPPRSTRAGISPLALVTNSPAPPQDPPPSERTSLLEEEIMTESSSRLSFYSNVEDESVLEDPMIENVLAYLNFQKQEAILKRKFQQDVSSIKALLF
ncbi:unnamed protein product [Strongylus vulgaris]|uniref:Uncharacterized protein n=1 Tax=Strongylus vulgaris TaxID=40348 RepID=A0A3P7M1I5_STRVU|nr:unnamed protein product [Strongylus vulgaris]